VWNMFWKMKVTGKVKIIAWRLINDGLTTKDNKVKRILEIVATCDICGREREKQDTICGDCSHAELLRQEMKDHWCLPDESKLRWTGPGVYSYCCGGIRRGGGLVEMSFRLQQARFTTRSGLW
jgi:hypothetical protein